MARRYRAQMTAGQEGLPDTIRKVVLVEGISDQFAVEAMARRHGLNLPADGVCVVPMGGATNIKRFLATFGPNGRNVELAGLYDDGEALFFLRGLELTGMGSNLTRADLAALDFYGCVADLEDELVRALGVSAVEQILLANGDLTAFRTFQQQPAQQGKSDQARLRRFMGTRGGRKIQYAPLLVNALDLHRAPAPLQRLVTSL